MKRLKILNKVLAVVLIAVVVMLLLPINGLAVLAETARNQNVFTFVVKDEDNYPLANAVIRIENETHNINIETITDSFGEAAVSEFTELSGDDDIDSITCDYTIEKDGYKKKTGTISASDDESDSWKGNEEIVLDEKEAQNSLTFNVTNPDEIVFSNVTAENVYTNVATGGSGEGNIVYRVNNTNLATVDSEGKVTIKHAGTIIVTAQKEGDGNYKASEPVQYTLNVTKGTQKTLEFNQESPEAIVYGESFTNTVKGGSGTGTVTYSIKSGNANVNSGGTVTPLGAGTIVVEAKKAADSDYNESNTAEYTLVVNRANQLQLFFEKISNLLLKYPFRFLNAALGGSGTGNVTYEVLSGNASVDDNGTITPSGAGEVVVQAVKEGDANYNESSPITYTLVVEKGNQPDLTFSKNRYDVYYGVTSVDIDAEGGSNETPSIEYSIVSGFDIGTIDSRSGEIRLNSGKTGTIVVKATKPGNDNWNAVSNTVNVVVSTDKTIEGKYSLIGDKLFPDSQWYTSNVVITPESGFWINTNNSFGGWTTDLSKYTISVESDSNNFGNIYLRRMSDGAISEASTIPLVKIDKTAPVIDISYINTNIVASDVGGMDFYDASQTAVITVTEKNFNASETNVNITATDAMGNNLPQGAYIMSTWSKDQGTDQYVMTVDFAMDGNYSLSVATTDMAGHTSNTPVKSFVIDTAIQAPTIMVNGKEGNGMAFKDDVSFSVSFTDENIDNYNVSLVKNGFENRGVDVTGQYLQGIAVEGTTAVASSNLIEKLPENDGIYTLSVSFTDKAGHSAQSETTFTVNRYGSVYEYSDYLWRLIDDGGAYIKNVDDDLLITEYNPSQLVESSLNIEITKDGKPIENPNISVSPEVNGFAPVGASGWYQYEYKIDKDNFMTDGVYKIVISSEDSTGNRPENTNYKGMSILFRVDRTKPEITSITGLEEDVINEDVKEVAYIAFDAIGLKSIKVFVDDAQVQEITDFSADINNYEGKFEIAEKTKRQSVKLVVTDLAGNVLDTSDPTFNSAYNFNSEVLVTTSSFARFVQNKLAVALTIAGTGAAVAVGTGLAIKLKKAKKLNK
ncbi:MAG: Ig-like domain repeat protein [Lachnospiraceae bacterium]|nr:Ig-like domain repeat protein [Lachnospiraceae bacterium]